MSIVFSAASNLSPIFSVLPRSLSTRHKFSTTFPESIGKYHQFGPPASPNCSFKWRTLPCSCRNSLVSDTYSHDKFPAVAARSTGPIAPDHLIEVVKTAAQTGAQVSPYSSFALGCYFTNESRQDIVLN